MYIFILSLVSSFFNIFVFDIFIDSYFLQYDSKYSVTSAKIDDEYVDMTGSIDVYENYYLAIGFYFELHTPLPKLESHYSGYELYNKLCCEGNNINVCDVESIYNFFGLNKNYLHLKGHIIDKDGNLHDIEIKCVSESNNSDMINLIQFKLHIY
jgi:hypothetical protein